MPAIVTVELLFRNSDGRYVTVPLSTFLHVRGPWVLRGIKVGADFDAECTIDLPTDIPVMPRAERRAFCATCGYTGRLADAVCPHCEGK